MGTERLFLFEIGGRRCALPIGSIDRVERAVAITPICDGSAEVLGLVNVQGRVVLVLDLRKRLGLPPREVSPDDSLVVLDPTQGPVAFLADRIEGLIEATTGDLSDVPGCPCAREVLKVGDGLALLLDVERMVSGLPTVAPVQEDSRDA